MSLQTAIALAYLCCVAAGIAALAAALRRHQEPTPPPVPSPVLLGRAHKADVQAVLTAAAQLAARISTIV